MNMPSPPQSTTLPNEVPRKRRWPKLIGFVSVGFILLILAAILIPCLFRGEMAANESSAIGCLRLNSAAQADFSKEHPGKGFATSLAELRPSFGDGQIDLALTSGTKNGYVFTITPGTPDSSGHTTSYTATANPERFQKTGYRSFFTDESGVIRLTEENRPATAADPPL